MDGGSRPSFPQKKNPALNGEEDGWMIPAGRESLMYLYIVSRSGREML